MTFDQISGRALTAEEEALVQAAFDRVRTQVEGDAAAINEANGRYAGAVATAITSGASATGIAQLERIGKARAKEELGNDLSRAVKQTANRFRDAEAAYVAAVKKAGRLLSSREIGEAAGYAHGTIRSILNRPDEEPTEASESGHQEQPSGEGEQPSDEGHEF